MGKKFIKREEFAKILVFSPSNEETNFLCGCEYPRVPPASTNRTTNQPTNQPTNQSTNQRNQKKNPKKNCTKDTNQSAIQPAS
ncbi:hypothetical protein DERF_010069 [Dermatophagoides farinae]|uniref:Uncharacterized protein n=1 Tax=Dermatophagoides farinae TaxID=6954 RepID=A0A922HVA5_DERFA|nr:hypothetical protein DERF_010069 [Dermatophagoides farinae]